ncbi:nitrilase-related carbon-nitrogen hydrolase [Cryobacterium sp. PH31-AA6]|uniref:nitrilase-related carbon-nitrogen hydrolase n=1 Tax=Cryobacterium sp. PH31-AA6 TaxID=3046205 RepID=UPI0024BACF16|nr:nitrilase-related carbon-nitrogen hydrolase [Cryobacterium sp. PH31-AA6]MDJ0325234.1 nitrilase-related carbon-nitrogen hydrolase [Cryobacterium sp. PH31-AA6]
MSEPTASPTAPADGPRVRLALFQGRAEPLDLAANLAILDEAAREARAAGAELLLTPELFATGYAPELIRESVSAEAAADLDRDLAGIAARHDIALVYSVPGPGPEDDRAITSALVDRTGRVLARYAKSHLFGAEERANFRPGSAPPPVVEFLGLKVALIICYDVEFPEVVRDAALHGATLVLVPTALTTGFENVARVLVPARALENSVTLAYANHVGAEAGLDLAGASVIVGPDGSILTDAARTTGLSYATVTAPTSEVDYLADRRPELYRSWSDASHDRLGRPE